MKKDTPGGPNGKYPTPAQATLLALAERPARAQARLDADLARCDRLRWRLVVLLGLCRTQEKYVTWLRSERRVNTQYLAEEEAFLARLRERVPRTLAALKEAEKKA